MFHIKVSLFARTKSLENKIDLFHDKIIDAAMTFKKAIRVFLNEKRSENYRKLSKQIKTIEHDADALRRDFSTVRDYSQKVYFIEHESDLTSGRMLEAIFDSELPLANKLQLDSLITEVADIADIAEDCVDELLIFTIKRDI